MNETSIAILSVSLGHSIALSRSRRDEFFDGGQASGHVHNRSGLAGVARVLRRICRVG
ncbi:MAG: hypothetical protein AAGC55_31690 [Myxococcota bacterium]